MAGPQACPTCRKPLPAGAFMCPHCELVVDGAQVERHPDAPKDPSVVFTLLAPADAKLQKAPGPPPLPKDETVVDEELGEVEDRPTLSFHVGPKARAVPMVVGRLDPKRYSLTTFEAYVVSLVDGVTTTELLGKAVGLTLIEIASVLHSLVQRGVIVLNDKPAKEPIPAHLRSTAPGIEVDMASARTEPFRQAAPAGMGQKASLAEAIALEKKGDFRGAIKVLAKAIEQSDQPAPLYNRLALVVIKERRDFAMAESLLEKAVHLDPKREVYLKNLAFASRLARMKKPA